MSFGLGFTTIEICRLMGLVDEYDRVIGDRQAPDWKAPAPVTDADVVRLRRMGRKRARAELRELVADQRRDRR